MSDPQKMPLGESHLRYPSIGSAHRSAASPDTLPCGTREVRNRMKVLCVSTNLLGQVCEIIRDCFLLRGMFSRDGFSRLHDKAGTFKKHQHTTRSTKTFDSRLAYTLVHLDILAPRNGIQLLRRQLENLLLPVLACDLRIDD